MKKRLVFYSFYAVIIFIILYVSFLIYFRNVQRATLFFSERRMNVLLIIIMTLFLSNLFDLIAFKKELRKESNLLNEVVAVVGKMLVIILITSFAEFFLFFRTKLGRVIYINLFVLLSLFLMIEHIIINYLIRKKKEKILWLSAIPYTQVEKDYRLNISQNEIHNNTAKIQNGFDLVIYDYPPKDHVNITDLLHTVISIKKPIDLITYVEEKIEKIPLNYVDELWLLKNIRTYESVYDKLRRIFNFFSCLVLLVVLFPCTFFVALLHRIESNGPLFFVQERVGYKGREFKLIKFRTMVNEAEKEGPRFADADDPRITMIGKIMRRFRIDEVPQLINVLKGDMNLIGPRPERKEFIEKLEEEISFYKLRLEIRPGLTGWAQVNFSYAGSNIADHLKKLEFDLYYIKNRSLALDIIILFDTIKTMLTRRGT